jgi:MSHA biogenesis protein MshJ
MMQAKWRQLLEKFSRLSSRERILILVAIFAVSYQLADFLILDRQFQKMEQLNHAMAQDNSAIVRVNTELNTLSSRVQNDPNIKLREQIQGASDEMESLQSRLQEVTGELISPQDMARFLEQLLVQEKQLTLLRLQTLDVRPLLGRDSEEGVQQVSEVGLHRHGFAIEFSGSYLATLRYLESLESLPWRFFWDSVSYEVLDFPESVVRLELHTLSLSEDWIGV